MRFKLLPPFFYWTMIVIQISWVTFVLVLLTLPINRHIEAVKSAILLFFFSELLLIPATIGACQQVCISKHGVSKCFLFMHWNKIPWSDVKEVGYILTGATNVTYKYIYIAKRNLSDEETKKGGLKDWKGLVAINYSEAVINSISTFASLNSINNNL
ncbi:MAG: hypothetical protein FWH42_03305 [Dehalococcoidia bacterium]|nr:hypothetical protein [Dehalococcoidia bacterium]